MEVSCMSNIIVSDPFICPKMQVDRGAIRFILSGANVMCPGLTSPGAKMTKVPEDTVVVSFANRLTWRIVSPECETTSTFVFTGETTSQTLEIRRHEVRVPMLCPWSDKSSDRLLGPLACANWCHVRGCFHFCRALHVDINSCTWPSQKVFDRYSGRSSSNWHADSTCSAQQKWKQPRT